MKKLLVGVALIAAGTVAVRTLLRNEKFVEKVSALADAAATRVVGVADGLLTKYDEFVSATDVTQDVNPDGHYHGDHEDEESGTVYQAGTLR